MLSGRWQTALPLPLLYHSLYLYLYFIFTFTFTLSLPLPLLYLYLYLYFLFTFTFTLSLPLPLLYLYLYLYFIFTFTLLYLYLYFTFTFTFTFIQFTSINVAHLEHSPVVAVKPINLWASKPDTGFLTHTHTHTVDTTAQFISPHPHVSSGSVTPQDVQHTLQYGTITLLPVHLYHSIPSSFDPLKTGPDKLPPKRR